MDVLSGGVDWESRVIIPVIKVLHEMHTGPKNC